MRREIEKGNGRQQSSMAEHKLRVVRSPQHFFIYNSKSTIKVKKTTTKIFSDFVNSVLSRAGDILYFYFLTSLHSQPHRFPLNLLK